jgi:hypothetical protein
MILPIALFYLFLTQQFDLPYVTAFFWFSVPVHSVSSPLPVSFSSAFLALNPLQ